VAKSIALTQQSSSNQESINSPYLVARREWDERYGGLIKRAKQWRVAAVLALLVALAEAIVIIGVATRPRTAPYVVAVDSLGRVAGRVSSIGLPPLMNA
jgi:type IV secretion system protein TrbF